MSSPEATARPATLGEQAGAHTESITVAITDVEDYLGRLTRRWDPTEPGSINYLADKALQLRVAVSRLEGALHEAAIDWKRSQEAGR
jgi:hypothetical protein